MEKLIVRVYDGLGNSKQSFQMILGTLRRHLQETGYILEPVTPEELQGDSWQTSTKLLVVGGGYDRGFLSALGERGTSNIRDYVRNGGAYLGICAGGYFGCDRIEFDKGGEQEVCGDRPLKFFPGLCVGPSFPGFEYDSENGAHAVRISWQPLNDDSSGDEEVYSYFNGGGQFYVDKSTKLDGNDLVEVLGTYCDLPDTPVSVVKCKFGEGVAVLSGCHFEYDPKQLNESDEFLKKKCVIPKITSSFARQEEKFASILSDIFWISPTNLLCML